MRYIRQHLVPPVSIWWSLHFGYFYLQMLRDQNDTVAFIMGTYPTLQPRI